MRRYRPFWTLRALAQLEEAELWWSQEKQGQPTDLIERELDRVFDILATNPHAGPVVPRRPGVRRILMKSLKRYLYYRVNEDQHALLIVAFWHTSRRRGPPL